MPKMSGLLLIFDLGIGDRRQAFRAPIYYSLSAVNESLFVKADENLAHRFGASFVHRKALSRPIAGGTELLELLHYASAVRALPRPRAFKESVASDIVLGDAFSAHRLDNLRLGCDGRMIRSGNPKGRKALHPLIADKHILKSVVERVSHMKLSCDIRRRYNDRIRRCVSVVGRFEISAFRPCFVEPVLKRGRVIRLRKFFHSISIPPHFRGVKNYSRLRPGMLRDRALGGLPKNKKRPDNSGRQKRGTTRIRQKAHSNPLTRETQSPT